MEKSPKKKLLLMFLDVQLDPVHVASKDGKIDTENIFIQFNGLFPSLRARKDFCSKAIFHLFSKLKMKYLFTQNLNIRINIYQEFLPFQPFSQLAYCKTPQLLKSFLDC